MLDTFELEEARQEEKRQSQYEYPNWVGKINKGDKLYQGYPEVYCKFCSHSFPFTTIGLKVRHSDTCPVENKKYRK